MYWCALLVVCCLAIPDHAIGEVTKSGSAYSGITVAINKEVAENPVLIDKIKSQFTSASRLLYEATGGWAYYGDITIALPETWKKSSAYATAYSDLYPLAEFRVDYPNRAYGDVPYTLQPGGCGERGEYVHLTPDFILKDDRLISEFYGPRDRILVHEWSHLRYGIFDEYGTPGDKNFPLFFFDDGMMNVNLCSGEIQGWMESDEGPICSVYNDHVLKDCVFIPDMEDKTTRSSLMSLHYLPSVDRFCTKDNHTGTVHNWAAPSKQNLLCQRRSAWEVISSHPDFSAKPNNEVPFRPPNFKIVRIEHTAPRFVFVLDVSGSMVNQPIALMRQSTNFFVNDLVKDDSYVGVVLFNNQAHVLQPLVKVSFSVRREISARIQSIQANGGTSIGSGIRAAINVLKAANQPTEDAVLIVISDGMENSGPTIPQVRQEVINSKVKVLAISFGALASKDMENLAAISNGKSVMFQNIQGTSTADLDQIFITATTIQGDASVQFVQLLNKPFPLTAVVTQTTVTLDAELGKNTVFTLAGEIAQVDLELQSPGGKRYLASSPEFTRTTARLQYKMATSETGKWTITLRRRENRMVNVDLGLISEPKNPKVQPIMVEAWIGNTEVKGDKGVKVYARVKKGSDVVIRATVEAQVVSDTGRKVMVELNDNGAGADAVKDDGVYSGFFIDFRANEKRYSVTALVTNRGKALIKNVGRSSIPILLRRKPRVQPKEPASKNFKLSKFQVLSEDPYADEPIGEKANDFDRTTNGGSFILKDFNPNQVDRIKPSPVNDLAVEEAGQTEKGQKFVTLSWTSPGDNMDVGTAAKLEVRICLNGKDFLQSWSSCHLMEASHVLKGDLNPRAGGQKHEVTLAIPQQILEKTLAKKAFDVYLAVRATDKAGNVGDLGKIAAGHFGYEIPDCAEDTGIFPRARHCEQFYHCSNGQAFIKNCPGNLHFSVEKMRCEWPCSAKCDPRVKCSSNV